MLTVADKPRDAIGIESLIWDTLIESDYEIMMANYYVAGNLLNNLRHMIDSKHEDLMKKYYKVCERYREKNPI